jgi:uncharacterized protein (DUF1697 family)
MSERKQAFVALLRGINVGGQHKISMAELRSACTSIGCTEVQTYIQSGNVVFSSVASAETLETRLEKAIENRFHFVVPVIVRSASKWGRYVKGNPFPDEAKKEGGRVVLALSKLSPKSDVASELERRATQGERVVKRGAAIWIHYAKGIGRSKLTAAVLDRCAGSPVTARNWRTALKLDEMVRAPTASQAAMA